MTPNQQRLVRETFARVRPIADTAASMGRCSPTRTWRSSAASSCRPSRSSWPASIAPRRSPRSCGGLGERHAHYGVADEHYETVGAALLDTLAAAFGDDFTPAVRDAWATAYAFVARLMQEGQRSAVCSAVA